MENKNLKLIDFSKLESQVFIVKDSFSRITFKEFQASLLIQMDCHLNFDSNNAVGVSFEEDEITEFARCAELFKDKQIVTFFDGEQNIELEVGYDISRTLDIFFELVDYSYDYSINVKPITYTICIDENSPNYEVLKEILSFMIRQKEKKEIGENHENRTYTTQYKRPSGL